MIFFLKKLNKKELEKNKIFNMSTNEYNNFSRSNGMVSNMSDSDSSSDSDEDENDYRNEFEMYIIPEDPETTEINLLQLIRDFVQETGFRIQNNYTLTLLQLQRYQLPQYNFVQDLITAYGYQQGTVQHTDLVTKTRLFCRNNLMFNDFINGIEVNIAIMENLIAQRQRIPVPDFSNRMRYIEINFEDLFEERPRIELDYNTPSIPGIETHTIPNSEFTDIDFRNSEFVAVKYFFLPEGNIPVQHPNIIKYQMNVIESYINVLLPRISIFYPNSDRHFYVDLRFIRDYRPLHPFIVENEFIDITYYNEYLQLYVLMAMYRYIVTYNGVHIRRAVFLEYMYQVEALLYIDDIQLKRATILNYIKFFKLKYLEQNPNN